MTKQELIAKYAKQLVETGWTEDAANAEANRVYADFAESEVALDSIIAPNPEAVEASEEKVEEVQAPAEETAPTPVKRSRKASKEQV